VQPAGQIQRPIVPSRASPREAYSFLDIVRSMGRKRLANSVRQAA
jgi:hypothetical protein